MGSPSSAPRGVVLAAGYGSRFLPVTRVVPKELLPIVARPALDLVVRELYDAGVRELLVITSRRKRAVEDWFDRDPELEVAFASDPDKLDAITPPDMSVQFVRQPRMTGTGGALALARAFAGDRATLVAFPDDLFGTPNASLALVEAWRATGCAVLGALDKTGEDVSAYGVIDAVPEGDHFRVRDVVEKPPKGTEPSHLVSTGRYLYTPELFDALARHQDPSTSNGEIHPMAAMREVATQGSLLATVIEAPHWDTGTPQGYLRAVVDHALVDTHLGPSFRAWLADRLARN